MKRLVSNIILIHSEDTVTLKKKDVEVIVPSTLRVLWVDPDYLHCYVIDIYSHDAFPFYRKVKDVLEEIENEVFFVTKEDPFSCIRSDKEMSDAEKNYRNHAWHYIKDIVYQEPEIFRRDKRGKLVRQVKEQFNIDFKTVYKHLKQFWQKGKNKNALLPNFKDCGGRGKEKQLGTKKYGRGREFPDEEGIGINVTEEVKEIFRKSLKRWYLDTKEKSLSHTYEMMTREYYSEKVINDRGELEYHSKRDIPTINQLRYWAPRLIDPEQTAILRKGYAKFKRTEAPIIHSSNEMVVGPGSSYQVDSTPADFHVVSELERTRITRRPNIYFVVDVFSRLITGLYVGFEKDTHIGYMMALINAASDKVEFCAKYGITIEPWQWASCHLPYSIRGDRGAMISEKFDVLSNTLNVDIENVASYQPQLKGIVEQMFRQQQTKLLPHLPGAINKNSGERGSKDPKDTAAITLKDLTKALIEGIIAHNTTHYLQGYRRSIEMRRDKVPAIPCELWKWGNENGLARLHTSYSEDHVKLNLLPVEEAEVTGEGIKFRGLHYDCDSDETEKWFYLAGKRRNKEKVSVSYDPRLVDVIYLRNTNNNIVNLENYEPAYLMGKDSISFSGLSFEEVKHSLKEDTRLYKSNITRERDGTSNRDARMEKIGNEATKAQKLAMKGKKITKKEKKSNINENTKNEKAIQSRESAVILDKAKDFLSNKIPVLPTCESPMDDDEFEDDYELL